MAYITESYDIGAEYPWRVGVTNLPTNAPVTRDDVWQLLDSLEQCPLTGAAKRMVKQAKRAKYNYRVAS
jgi:hypothetical protein